MIGGHSSFCGGKYQPQIEINEIFQEKNKSHEQTKVKPGKLHMIHKHKGWRMRLYCSA